MRITSFVRTVAGAAVALASIGGATPSAASFADCRDDGADVYEIPENPLGITGKIAFPQTAGDDLVVYAHGYGHTSNSWVQHLTDTAERGAVTFAVDYRGTYTDEAGNVRGWFVREGAQDMIDVARLLLLECEHLSNVILYGISMGANSSGLAAASGAQRPDGSPLFDWWVAPEPAANVIETYLEATLVAPANGTATRAKEDIEREHGGTLWERPQSYVAGAVVSHAHEIAASGIKGVAVLHGFDDGLVPYNQGRELATLLRAHGLPTDFYNAVRRETDGTATGSDNTTLTENAARPVLEGLGQEYTEPLAGHGTESSQTNGIVRASLDIVYALMNGSYVPANHEFLLDDGVVTQIV